MRMLGRAGDIMYAVADGSSSEYSCCEVLPLCRLAMFRNSHHREHDVRNDPEDDSAVLRRYSVGG